MKTPTQLSDLSHEDKAAFFRDAVRSIYEDAPNKMDAVCLDLDISTATYKRYMRGLAPLPVLLLLQEWKHKPPIELSVKRLRAGATSALALADMIEAGHV